MKSRDKQIKKLIESGLTQKETAKKLGISLGVVRYAARKYGFARLDPDGVRVRPVTAHPKRTLCWDCRNATNSKCNWSRNLKPVEGWTAKPVSRQGAPSFLVSACPEFEEDTRYAR